MDDMVYFQIFRDMEELLEEYDDAQRGRLLTAMMAYAFRGEKAVFEGAERYIWPAIRQRIDQSAAKLYKNRENGQKGGRPSAEKPNKTQQNPTKPNLTQLNHKQEQEQEQEHDKEQEQPKSVKRGFTPPETADVDAFCAQNGISGVDAQRFVDYYASKGWKVGSAPMKDWQAAVRNWARNEQARGSPRTVSAQNYTQRRYTDSDLAFCDDALLKEAAALGS